MACDSPTEIEHLGRAELHLGGQFVGFNARFEPRVAAD